jgi:type IV pilus assembly protein PilE
MGSNVVRPGNNVVSMWNQAMVKALRYNTTRKSGSAGFTLIELLIVVVILGILAGIVYPNYTNYVTKSRRSEATIGLTRIAALQERFFTQCGVYAQTFGAAQSCTNNNGTLPVTELTITSGTTVNTLEGNYTITLAGTPTTFTLTAAPNGLQATRDLARCATFTISNTGLKTATGTDGNLTNGGNCWR